MTGFFDTTGGPWYIDYDRDEYDVEIVGHPSWGCTRFGVKGEWGVATIDLAGSNDANANARAIAQVPAMLELVTMALYASDQNTSSLRDAARAIVAELEKE